MPWPWRKGRWKKKKDPAAWPMPHENTEHLPFKTEEYSIWRQSNGKLFGTEI